MVGIATADRSNEREFVFIRVHSWFKTFSSVEFRTFRGQQKNNASTTEHTELHGKYCYQK